MSRRKQSKPQCVHMDSHLTLSEQLNSDYHIQNTNSLPRDVHVCESCSAEYFSLSDLQEHQLGCFRNSLVLLGSENPVSPCSTFTFTSPTHNVEEQTNNNISIEDTEGLHNFFKDKRQEENNSFIFHGNSSSQSAYENSTSVPVHADSPPELGKVMSINSNVFIENLESTNVAVAQFSQEICLNAEVNFSSLTNCSMAVPKLIEQLLALQQQQVQQLKLIEQIRHQILLLATQNMETSAHSSTCQGTSEISQTNSLVTLSSSLSQHLAEAAGLAQSLARQSTSISKAKQINHAVSSSNQDSTAVLSVRDISQMTDTNRRNLISRLGTHPPKKQTSHDSTFCKQPSVKSPSPFHAFTTDNAPNLASNFSLPQSARENYISANRLLSIGEIVEDMNTLTALAQQRRGRLSKVTSSEHKRPFDEDLFKHKCRFCAKVFGSDSALKIHIRSHTGERPYKCNICGNRFSTRGNLKVHFQRHKEKHPNIQMNPYPVPEHLDNVPTNTGIPYGMSLVPDKPTSKWLDSKPSVTILPGLLTSSMPSFPSIIKRETKVVPTVRPSSLDALKGFETSERRKDIKQELNSILSPKVHEKYEDLKQYFNFTTNLDSSGNGSEECTSIDVSMDDCIHKNLVTPILCENFKPKCPLGSLPDLTEASETTKLQQMVENIDKKCIDPNQCIVCHRVLSCQSALRMHYRTHTGERPFKCKICGRAFTTKGNLKTHLNIHRDSSPLKFQHSCPLCQEKFTNATVLQRHIRIHMINQLPNDALQERNQMFMEHVTCSVIGKNCDDNFPDDNMEITESVLDSIDAVSPLNSLCSSPSSISSIKNVAQENNLLIDSLENEPVEGEYFTIKSSTGDDQINQRASSPTLSETSQDLMLQKSSALDNYICLTSETHHRASSVELAGTSISQPKLTSSLDSNTADIINHGMAVICPSSEQETHKTNACEVCNKTFTCQSALDIHYRSHTKERPFLCMECNRGFSTKGNLKQHMLTHQLKELPSSLFEPANENLLSLSNPSPPTMGYLIPSKIKMEFNSTLNKDGNESLRMMTSLAPSLPVLSGLPSPTRRTSKQHFCHTCGKTFSSSSALQIHERTHTGEKPFACTICGRAFTTKGNLKVHMGTHMWNGSLRGRRLSVDGPLRFLKSNLVKDPETFPKSTVSSGESIAIWNQYVTAPLTTGLALKSNEISVIQNGSIPYMSPPVGHGGNSPIGGLTASQEKPHNVEISRVALWHERPGENGTSFHITPLTEEGKTD